MTSSDDKMRHSEHWMTSSDDKIRHSELWMTSSDDPESYSDRLWAAPSDRSFDWAYSSQPFR